MNAVERIAGLLHLPALPEESASDYLIRLFEIEGRAWSRERLATLGITLSDLMFGEYGSVLPRFTKIDIGCFEATTPIVHSKKDVRIGTRALHRDEWSTLSRRWCPECFAEDIENEALGGRHPDWRIHRRWWWNVTAIRNCPRHGVRLESTCRTCGTEVTWESGSLTTCRNGHSLVDVIPINVSEDTYRADALLLDLLLGNATTNIPLLDGAEFSDVVQVLERLGVMAFEGAFGAFAKVEEGRRGKVLSAGLAILTDFPAALVKVLDTIADRPEVGFANWGVDQVYGYIVGWARSNGDKPWARAILEVVHKHHAEHGYARGNSAAAAFVSSEQPLSLNDAADRLKRSAAIVRRYLDAIGALPAKTGKGTPITVRIADVERLEALFADTIEVEEVMRILSIPKTSLTRLTMAGALPEDDIHAKVGVMKGRFTRAGITAWLERLTTGVPVYDEIPTGLAPISNAGKGSVYGGIVGAVTMVSSGRAPVAGRLSRARGLEAVLIDPDLFDRIHLGMREDEITVTEAAAILDLHEETVWAAVHVGLIEVRWLSKQRAAFSRLAIGSFGRTIVTLGTLAASLKTTPSHLAPVMNTTGVKPILSPEINSRSRSTVYCKHEIPRDLAERYRKAFGR